MKDYIFKILNSPEALKQRKIFRNKLKALEYELEKEPKYTFGK
jgi:hypothetical protein